MRGENPGLCYDMRQIRQIRRMDPNEWKMSQWKYDGCKGNLHLLWLIR